MTKTSQSVSIKVMPVCTIHPGHHGRTMLNTNDLPKLKKEIENKQTVALKCTTQQTCIPDQFKQFQPITYTCKEVPSTSLYKK